MNKPFTPAAPFVLEEATIDELHAAIKAGHITVRGVVEHYLARVRAYNGTSNLLVTKDGATIPEAKGTTRGGAMPCASKLSTCGRYLHAVAAIMTKLRYSSPHRAASCCARSSTPCHPA